jgi:hypothetical protein
MSGKPHSNGMSTDGMLKVAESGSERSTESFRIRSCAVLFATVPSDWKGGSGRIWSTRKTRQEIAHHSVLLDSLQYFNPLARTPLNVSPATSFIRILESRRLLFSVVSSHLDPPGTAAASVRSAPCIVHCLSFHGMFHHPHL